MPINKGSQIQWKLYQIYPGTTLQRERALSPRDGARTCASCGESGGLEGFRAHVASSLMQPASMLSIDPALLRPAPHFVSPEIKQQT
jgi:hypothetical protein